MNIRDSSTAIPVVGFDVGGTFTDVLLRDAQGVLHIGKYLTDASDPAGGAIRAIEATLKGVGSDTEVGRPKIASHGTTLVTNAIIENKGARTGLITNLGFEDTLEIGTGTRYDLYDLFLPFREPLVPQPLRKGISARITHIGEELCPVDPDEVVRAVQELLDQHCEAIAVCLLHSYANDSHEREVAELVRHLAPAVHVCVSAEFAAQIGEYERTSTTVANAFVQPQMATYLGELESWLGDGRLLLMGSNGGTVSTATARKWPISLIESGPAAGALAAASYARRLDLDSVISFDMGGTTAKACLIDDGDPQRTPEFEAARVARFKPSSGIPLQIQVVNLIEIGAGGGSIASIDQLGLLKVGPESAGASPGPACYGTGGSAPTVTDANLILGFLGADSFLGGEMALSPTAATSAVETIATGLDLELPAAAWGIYDIVNESMASAVRVHAAERNRDPRRYSMIAFGGAGPVHAVEVARKVGIPEVIVPMGAGAMSCFGLLAAPVAVDLVRSAPCLLDDADFDAARIILKDLEVAAGDEARSAIEEGEIAFEHSVDMRYVGQAHEVVVPINASAELSVPYLRRQFETVYADLYSLVNEDMAIEILNWRLRAVGPARPLPSITGKTSGESGQRSRPVWSPAQKSFRDVRVVSQAAMTPGAPYGGPLIVEQAETTAVVGVDDVVLMDRDGTLRIQVKPK